MSGKIDADRDEDSEPLSSGDELAARIFTLTMVGVFVAILLMVITADW